MMTPSQKVSDFSTQLRNVSLGLPVQSDKVQIVTRVVQYLDHLPTSKYHARMMLIPLFPTSNLKNTFPSFILSVRSFYRGSAFYRGVTGVSIKYRISDWLVSWAHTALLHVYNHVINF